MPLPHGLIPGPQGWSVSHHIQGLGPNRIPVVACEERTGRTLPSGECQERCSGPRVRNWGSEARGSHLACLPARTAPKTGTCPRGLVKCKYAAHGTPHCHRLQASHMELKELAQVWERRKDSL